MERYTLLIFEEGSSTFSEDEALHYYKTHKAANSCISISRQVYVAVLKIALNENNAENKFMNEKFVWTKHDELDENLNAYNVSNWLTLAAAINILADHLPDVGQYYMDVLCCGDIFFQELPKDKIEICVSLERLDIWHNAHIVIRQPKDPSPEQLPVLEKWAWWLNASISNDPWPFPDLKFWHGSLAMPMDLLLPGFEMVLAFPDDNSLLSCLDSHSLLKKLVFGNEVTHVSTSLEVLSDCSLTTVPPYLFSHYKFLLQISNSRRTYNACHSFIDFLENRPGMAIVFGLYFTCSGSNEDHQKLDFEAWIKTFQSGKLPDEHPQTCLPEDSPHLTFLVYWDPTMCEPHRSLVAHLLVDPGDLDLQPCLLPLLENRWPLTAQKEQDTDWNALIPKLDEDLEENDRDFINENDHLIPVDPSDWPERRFLLLRELKKQKSRGSLDGLSPPVALRKVIELRASDFSSYFDSSGRPKKTTLKTKNGINAVHKLEGGQGKFSVNAQHAFEDVLSASWSELLQYQYHDLYLNKSTWMEELEVSCNKLKDQFILEETSSSDPNRQESRIICVVSNAKRSNITKKEKTTSPRKGRGKNKSPYRSYPKSCRSSPRTHQNKTGTKPKALPFTGALSNSNKLLQSQANPLPSQAKLLQSQSRASHNLVRQTILNQVRSSPRFKKWQSSEQAVNVDKQSNNDLSEKHKKKLREAVALALESEGVTLSSPSFKLCGRRLFNVCKAFIKDILGKGNTSALMKKIAAAHVKQVIEFEKIKA